MRWIPFAMLGYVIVAIQVAAGKLLTFDSISLGPIGSVGPIGPDLAALLVVFVAMSTRLAVDAMLAGCLMGFLVDLTAAGGVPGLTRVGPMVLAYALGAYLIFRLREYVFRERALLQMLLAAVFTLVTHSLWVTVQLLLAEGESSWATYGYMLGQVLCSALYTGLLMWPAFHLFHVSESLILASPARSRRNR